MDIFETSKGHPCATYKGYAYRKTRVRQDGSVHWVCMKERLFKCKGRLLAHGTTVLKEVEHQCKPDELKCQLRKACYRSRKRAREESVPISKIYKEELEPLRQRMAGVSSGRMPDYPSLKSSLYRQRKISQAQAADATTADTDRRPRCEDASAAAPITPRQPPQLGPSTSKAPLASTPLPNPFPIPLPSVPHTPLVSDVIAPPPVPQKTYLPPPPPPTYSALPNLPQRPPSPIAPAPTPCPPNIQDEAVTVQWNSYATNMSTVMPNLLEDEKFVDVTLACDGQYIKCHKVILGACSSYFEELLSANPCKHPIILMKDFQFSEIKAIVEFIYRGSVNIPQEKLPDILQVANKLKIKGLMGSKENDSSTERVDTDDNSCSRLAMFNASISSASSGIAGKEEPHTSKRKPSQNTLKTPRSTSPRSLSTSSTSAEPHRKQPKLFYSHLQDDPESSSSSLRSDNSFPMTDSSADFGGSLELLTGTTRIKEESSFLDPSTLYHQNTDNSFVTSPFELLTVQSNIKLEPEEPQQNFRADPVDDDPGASVSEDPSI